MQKGEKEEISFEKTDELISRYQEGKVAVLATLWPFADWDQKSKPKYKQYRVSENDEFLPRNDDKGRGDYLPDYRGNPNDWEAYKKWVKVLVERYDGDGKNDMPGLEIPIKYWEVMNEPDLSAPKEEEGNERLDFYKEDATAYAKLLTESSKAIREADPQAKILIAGAAGGNNQFLGFYRQVFKNKEAVSAFDIGNVHCISNDDFGSFNLKPYKEMLAQLGINKPVWITEAEAMVSGNPDVNATQMLKSTDKALELGAQRIFYTRYEFKNQFDAQRKPFGEETEEAKPEISGQDAVEAYRKITSR